jgi:broad specificity phosphatase PhoE
MQSLTSDTNITTDPERTTIVLVRHAVVEQSPASHRMFGWTDVELSEQGRRQADMIAARLKDLAPGTPIYASTLARARATAGAIADGRPVRLLHSLKEINCGKVDGWPVKRVQNEYPSLWKANFRYENDDFCWPGGESYRRFRIRALRVLRAIVSLHRGETVVVVTHSGLISQVVGYIQGFPPARWGEYRAGHASITTVASDGERGKLIRFDDRTHLEAVPR